MRLTNLLLIVVLIPLTQTSVAQPPDTLRFLTGSCAFINRDFESEDGILYNNDTSIYYTMSKKPAEFMLWLGDNWYYSAQDLKSEDGMAARIKYVREAPSLKHLNASHPVQYAIWDDHDYGPNNSARKFSQKDISRKLFIETWTDNPSFGVEGEGIFTSFRKGNVRFLLLDDRWWRSKSSTWAHRWLFFKNKDKKMWGDQQMDWLKKELLKDSSAAMFVIVNGSQILNPLSGREGLIHYPVEYEEVLNFIVKQVQQEVVFLTGDRHFSEVIRREWKGRNFFDITVSPLSSSGHKPRLRERKNRHRVGGSLLTQPNFAEITIFPTSGARMVVRYFDNLGKELYQFTLHGK